MVETYDTKNAAELARLGRLLKELAAAGGKDARSVLWAFAGRFAAGLVMRTQPFGRAKAAQEKGERAVRRDVGKVYVAHGRVYRDVADQDVRRAVYAKLKDGEARDVEGILSAYGMALRNVPVDRFDDGAAHRRRRNQRGRISSQRPEMIPLSDTDRRQYADEVTRRVGWSKAGWLRDFHPPGGLRGIPAFVLRHVGKAPGSVREKRNDAMRPAIVFRNAVRWITKIFNRWDADYVFRGIVRAMERDLKRQIERNAKALIRRRKAA